MKKKQKNIYKLILILIVVILVFSCSNKKSYDWTILVYMAADNSLSTNALSDINELEKANFDEDKIKVIVLSDLLNIPQEERLKEDSKIFDIQHDDNPSEVTSHSFSYNGEKNTGDYKTLVDFANRYYNKYPAERHALFIWSHGNGWYSYYDKFCVDHSSMDFFNIPNGDLKMAISEIHHQIDILGLDACNMQSLEVLNEIYRYVPYVVSSEYEINADGFPYDDILNTWNDYSTTKNISVNIAKKIFESYMPGGSQNINANNYLLSFSSISSIYYSEFINDLKNFLNMDLYSIKEEIVDARDESSSFFDMDYSSQIDIMQFFIKLKTKLRLSNQFVEVLDKLIDDLEKMTVYHEIYLFDDNTGYATIWFPTQKSTYDAMISDYKELTFFDTGWDKILQVYFSDKTNNVDKKNSK